MSYRSCLIAAVMLMCVPSVSKAQVFGNNSLFEPTIDVVNSGAKLDVQATVSADRKYVTMTLRPQTAELLQLRTFQFQGGGNIGLPGGFIGGVMPVIQGAITTTIPQAPNAPVTLREGNGGAVLLQRGITPLIVDGR
jgi:hypothetical protein